VKPLLILLGALFTAAASLSAGLLLFQRLRLKLYRQEVYPYAFVTGSAVFSLLIFALAAMGVLSTWTIIPSGILLIGISIRTRAWKRTGPAPPRLSRWWLLFFSTVLSAYGTVYLAYAVAPEVSPDGSAYHLGLVSRYLRQHGFGWITTNMYANLSMGIEMLYISAFSIGKHPAAAVLHLLFLVDLPLMILAFARRHGQPVAGITAGLLVYCSPVFGQDGSTAYIDVALAAVAFCLFCFLQIWAQERARSLLVPVGLLAGFAYACKLTAFVAVPYALAFVLYNLLRARQPLWKPLFVLSACAATMILPWIVKNSVVVGNPFSPFFNRWFPNPYVSIVFEEEYIRGLRSYEGVNSTAQIPAELTIRGGRLNGLLGPAFLLAPAALVAARWPLGRQLLLAGAVFASTYPANIGTRFIMAAIPFLALGMGMVFSHWRVSAAVVAFHVLSSWYSVIPYYAAEHAWRIGEFRLDQALRRESDDEFLRRALPGYGAAQLVNERVPRNGKVLQFQGVAEAYVEREVLTCYQAALNNMLCETWASGTELYYLPSRDWKFEFAEITTRKLRLIQTARSQDVWSVSELRILGPSGEIPRQADWRIKASRNPWDVQLAFDNCPTTRWKAWERAEPGMFLEIDFGEPTKVTGVLASIAGDNPRTTGRVDFETEPDRWQTIAQKPEDVPVPPLLNSRRNAIDDIKRYGITHLVVDRNEFLSIDLFRNQAAWGIALVGETQYARLYRIE
jgi:hypothetical protein